MSAISERTLSREAEYRRFRRDLFFAAALTGILSNPKYCREDDGGRDFAVKLAWKYADEAVRQRDL